MRVLVIIVTYNAMKWIERCISSVQYSSVHSDIFVVDNGSTDGTCEYLKNTFPDIAFYQTYENLGFGKANNIGLKYALENDYDYVYLLNQDAWVFSNTIESLIVLSKNHPDYGIISPFQMESNNVRVDSMFLKGVCSYNSNKDLFNDFFVGTVKDIYQVEKVMAAHWLITRECILKTGLFSPTFPHYGEDDNYVDRASFFDFKIGIATQIRAVHDRANRPYPKSKVVYMRYIDILKQLSSVKEPNYGIFKVFLDTIKSFVKYRDYHTFSYLFSILANYQYILKNKKQSMSVGAFC